MSVRDSTVNKARLGDEDAQRDVRRLSASEKLAMVWQITLQAWMFRRGTLDEPRLSRHVVRIVRGGS